MTARRVTAVAIVVVALVLIVLVARLGDDVGRVDSAVVGTPAPAFRLDDALSGQPVEGPTSDRVTVMNFWAPWCVACIAEHAELNSAAIRLRDAEAEIVGVSVHADKGDVRSFLDRGGAGYPVVIDDGRVAIDYGVFGVPETFIVDADGTVAARITGPVTAELVLEMIADLRAGAEIESTETGDVQTPPA